MKKDNFKKAGLICSALVFATFTAPIKAHDTGGNHGQLRERLINKFDQDGDGQLNTREKANAREAFGKYRDKREDVRDRREDIADKRENIRDRKEDKWDRREDVRDRKEDRWDAANNYEPGTPAARWDRREDVRDAREDVYDRREDVRDRREDVYDRREDFRDQRPRVAGNK